MAESDQKTGYPHLSRPSPAALNKSLGEGPWLNGINRA
jgi:hypothetical protein